MRSESADSLFASDPALQLQRKVWRARAVLAVERLWIALWLPLGVSGVFVLLSLVNAWQFLSPEIHRIALWAFGAAFLVSFVPLMRVRWPSREEALRRLETTAGLPHRPASAYQDRFAVLPHPLTVRLWDAHRGRMALLFARLRAGWPKPCIAQHDPFALRALLLLLLAVAFAAYYGDVRERLWAGLTPPPLTLTSSARLDAWITPPVYTGIAPVMLANGSQHVSGDKQEQNPLTVPEKSELAVRINHANASRFSLKLKPLEGGESKTLGRVDVQSREGTIEFKETLVASGVIELRDGGSIVARWPVGVVKDTAPRITMTKPPQEALRGSLQLHYKVEDDYGVVSAEALIEPAAIPAEDAQDTPSAPQTPVKRLGKAPQFPLVLPRANTKHGAGKTYRNLVSHYWAGLPVTVTLEARDQAGQFGRSRSFQMILPERQFTNPMSRALIEQRKKLVTTPSLKDRVAKALDALTIAPETFIQNFSVYLGVRTAYWRLKQAKDDAELESVADLLWSVAVHLEDGDLSDSEQQLRTAQQRLMQALQENASDEEIRRLTNELRTALNRFLNELQERAQNGQEFDPRGLSGNEQAVTPQDLDKILKKIEDLARTGSRDAARQLLSQLRDMLENAQTGSQANADLRKMKETLDNLSQIIGKQQRLLDETYRTHQQEQPQPNTYGNGYDDYLGDDGRWMPDEYGQVPEQHQGNGQSDEARKKKAQKYSELEERQKALQQQLRDFQNKLKGLGGPPMKNFRGAGQDMKKAEGALGQKNGGRASEQQTRALEKLRKGAKSLAEKMMSGNGSGSRGMGRNGRDPLGRQRPGQGLSSGDTVKVPDEGDLMRARQILEELRRRLGERTRSADELDYIERLIQQY